MPGTIHPAFFSSPIGEPTLPDSSMETPFDSLDLPKAFLRRCRPENMSPMSSQSSGSSSPLLSSPSSRSAFEEFFQSSSRVVKLFNLPPSTNILLYALFNPQKATSAPVELWSPEVNTATGYPEMLWAVYETHEEAAAALSLSGSLFSVTTALESDLQPLSNLRRFSFSTGAVAQAVPRPRSSLRVSPSHYVHSFSSSVSDQSPTMEYGDYAISSNPPNPKNSFRLGDWMCSSPKCAAHNFGRNFSCIGCGYPRTANSVTAPPQPPQSYPSGRVNSSPRFAAYQHSQTTTPLPSPLPLSPLQFQQHPLTPPSASQMLPVHQRQVRHHFETSQPSPGPRTPPKNAHPLLTPSGQAFAVGGKVQNVSSDPLTPCIMWWPDNEPLPEQGQIRPASHTGVHQPPILNTGNKGPITHQPGDWVCKKCNYLNWRRRKVCQTCLPYAEGNGDSISAAVQAERIHLLQNVLSHTQSQSTYSQPLAIPHVPRSHSLSPPEATPSLVHSVSPNLERYMAHRSHSNADLNARFANTSPIYETSGTYRQPSPLYTTGPGSFANDTLEEPAPLLPSFLQDIVQSPTLSPTSTSSADLSLEDYDDLAATTAKMNYALSLNSEKPSKQSIDDSIANIWRLDGDESRSLGSFNAQGQDTLWVADRNMVHHMPRAHLIAS